MNMSAFSKGLTDAQKAAALADHNRYRGMVTNPTAANMPDMIWDDELAMIAQKWAETCIADHDTNIARSIPGRFSVGQNLAFGYSTISGSIKAWFDEKDIYTFGQANTGKEVGHYTQIVWATSTSLGCGFARCGTRNTYVCNYGPGGNIGGVSNPYIAGPSASACPNSRSGNLCACAKSCENTGTLDVNSCACKCKMPFHVGQLCQMDCGLARNDPQYCVSQYLARFPNACAIIGNVPAECPNMCNVCPAGGINYRKTTATAIPSTTTTTTTPTITTTTTIPTTTTPTTTTTTPTTTTPTTTTPTTTTTKPTTTSTTTTPTTTSTTTTPTTTTPTTTTTKPTTTTTTPTTTTPTTTTTTPTTTTLTTTITTPTTTTTAPTTTTPTTTTPTTTTTKSTTTTPTTTTTTPITTTNRPATSTTTTTPTTSTPTTSTTTPTTSTTTPTTSTTTPTTSTITPTTSTITPTTSTTTPTTTTTTPTTTTTTPTTTTTTPTTSTTPPTTTTTSVTATTDIPITHVSSTGTRTTLEKTVTRLTSSTTRVTAELNDCHLFKPVPNDPHAFMWRVNNIIMRCAPGVNFNPVTCKCDVFVPLIIKDICPMEFSLHFTRGRPEDKAHHVYVSQRGVRYDRAAQGGVFVPGSRLLIYRFSSYSWPTVWGIQVEFQHVEFTAGADAVLVSTCACMNALSGIDIRLRQDENTGGATIVAVVETSVKLYTITRELSTPTKVTVAHLSVQAGGLLRLSVSDEQGAVTSNVTAISGTVKVCWCPLSIGSARQDESFVGILSKADVYTYCLPSDFHTQ